MNIQEFKESIESVENINGKFVVLLDKTYLVFDETDDLKDRAVKGSITEDDYVQELARRILQVDPSLCLKETSLEKIQAVLDSKDIIVPAIVFKAMFDEWGFPVLRKINLEKEYPYGINMRQAQELVENGVRYW